MKKFLKNNFFTNPEGWAGAIVGPKWRYILMQSFTVFGAVSLIIIFAIGSKNYDWGEYFGVFVTIISFAAVFPMAYLRTLRHLYLKSRQSQNNQDK